MIADKRIVITRAEEQAGELVARLRALGAEPFVYAAIAFAPPADTAPLDAALAQVAGFDWLICTSANAVRFTWERMAALGVDSAALHDVRIGAVGPATAQALREHGMEPTLVATTARAEGLLAEFDDVRGLNILLPCADIARSELADGLRKNGATVTVAVAYRTIPGPGIGEIVGRLRDHAIDALLFASPSAVRYLLQGIDAEGIKRDSLHAIALICIGPTTAAAVRGMGLHVAAVASEPSADGIIAALQCALSVVDRRPCVC